MAWSGTTTSTTTTTTTTTTMVEPASQIRGASIDMHSQNRAHSTITRPQSARFTPSKAATTYELDDMKTPTQTTTSLPSQYTSTSPSSKTPSALEASAPPTPPNGGPPTTTGSTGIVPSWSYPAMNKWRVLCACLTYFGNGMNDSAPGALIPSIEQWYTIGYAIVSLIFISNAVGFIAAAFVAEPVVGRLGRARALVFAEICMLIGYAVIAAAPPFAVVVVAYFVLGFGNALNLAYNNVFCANLANSTVILGASHGSYGVGGILAPIVATAMVSSGIFWARFYLVTIGVRVLCLGFACWAFWDYEREDTTRFSNSLQQLASRQAEEENDTSGSKMRLLGRALKSPVTLIGAAMIFAYQGAEVSESGWFISYLIQARDGDPARVGYVTSGFWGGITLGRFVLTHLAHRVGEKLFVTVLGIAVIAFQLMAWFVPSVVGDAVAVAILGLLLGPIYPCSQTIFVRSLPPQIQMIAISFISSAGSSGGAVVPFITGLIAQSAGTFVLHPICIASYVIMLGCWASLPRLEKRKV